MIGGCGPGRCRIRRMAWLVMYEGHLHARSSLSGVSLGAESLLDGTHPVELFLFSDG